MKSTEMLMQEHEVIEQKLKILNKVCEKLQSGEQVDGSHLEKIVDVIRNFAGFHSVCCPKSFYMSGKAFEKRGMHK